MKRFGLLAAALLLSACETLPELQSLNAKPAATVAPAPAAPTAEQALLDMERKVAAVAQEKGIAAALAGVMANDGFVVRPGTVFQGPEAVQSGLAGPASAGPFFWQADRVFVSSAGDLGVTSGRFAQVVKGAEAIQGRYVMVWRKDADGVWRGLTEVNSVDPRAAPPPLAGPPLAGQPTPPQPVKPRRAVRR